MVYRMACFEGLGTYLDYYVFVSSYRPVVFPSLYRFCGAVYLCIGNGLFRSRTDGVYWDGRYFGSFPCRLGSEQADSSCISSDESSGVCG